MVIVSKPTWSTTMEYVSLAQICAVSCKTSCESEVIFWVKDLTYKEVSLVPFPDFLPPGLTKMYLGQGLLEVTFYQRVTA